MTAVAARSATADQRQQALSPYQALLALSELDPTVSTARLIDVLELAVGRGVCEIRAPGARELLTRIESALELRTLLIIPGWSAPAPASTRSGTRDRETAPDDRLAELVMGTRATVVFDGSRYRVMSMQRWREQQEDGQPTDFRLLPAREARVLLKRIVDSAQTPPGERAAWQQVVARLFDGTGAAAAATTVNAGAGAGVVLLRHAPPVQRRSEDAAEPPLTPARLVAQVAITHWIEVEILCGDGSPFLGNCTVELPDGQSTTGPVGADGLLRVEGIQSGSCKISFPDFEVTP